MQGKKRQIIFGIIGLGCGIVLSGILNLLLLLNTTEYKNGITLNANQMTQNMLHNDNEKREQANQKNNLQDEAAGNEQEKADAEPVQPSAEIMEKTEEIAEVTVTIPPEMTASETCEILEAAGVINNAKDFKEYVRERKMTTKLNEGTFVLRKNMSYNELLDKLMID